MAGSSYDGEMMRISILVGLIVTVVAQTNAGVSSTEVKSLETKITRTARLQYLVQYPANTRPNGRNGGPYSSFCTADPGVGGISL